MSNWIVLTKSNHSNKEVDSQKISLLKKDIALIEEVPFEYYEESPLNNKIRCRSKTSVEYLNEKYLVEEKLEDILKMLESHPNKTDIEIC